MGLGGFEFKQESYEHEQYSSSGHGHGNGHGHGYGHATAPYCAPSHPSSHYGNSSMAAQGYHQGGGYSSQNSSFLGHNSKHDHQFLLGNKHNMGGWSNGSHGGSKLSSYHGDGHAMGAGIIRHGGGGGGGGFYQKNEQTSSANYEESSWSSGHSHGIGGGMGMGSNRIMYGGGYPAPAPAVAWASKAL